MKTIGVDLWGGQARGVAPNHATRMDHASAPRTRRSFRELFVSAYAAFAPACRAVEEPGLAVIAVDERTGKPSGIVTLRARVERHVAAIVGRHDHCDLYLTASSSLALRHLVVILDPVSTFKANDATVRYRVLDLRTTDGFSDESDRPLRGLRCEGPALLRCAGHALFILPLGDSSDWPRSADDAWSFLPERVYFDELDRSPQASRVDVPSLDRMQQNAASSVTLSSRSMIVRTQGPRDTAVGRVDVGELAGTLELVSPRQRGIIRIGVDALRDGVLLGRYARCDAAKLADDASLSRVHALLIQIDRAMILIDTASLNGSRELDRPNARVIAVDDTTELVLGTATRARWRWVS